VSSDGVAWMRSAQPGNGLPTPSPQHRARVRVEGMISSHAATVRRREDLRLLRLYHGAGDARAREELVHRFLPLARQLARRYQRRGEPIDDLVQVASLGLLKAIDRFDPDRQTTLSSFAIPTILGELKRYFRDFGWAVRVPRSLQERMVRVDEATDALWREQGRPPTPAEVAERTQHRFGEDLYQSEIAERVGVSPTQVARILTRSIEALRETLDHPARPRSATMPPSGEPSLRAAA
jgi:RNA polymerase sigma factor (sigma-70 family)